MAIFYGGYSIPNKRPINMDSLLLKERIVAGVSVCLAVVCDGVGSTQDGTFASAFTIKMLGKWFDQLTDISRPGLDLRNYILKINDQIVQKARERGLHTASTVSALLLCKETYYIVNVGDSRIYKFWNCGCKQLTKDQALNGKLTSWLGRPGWTEVFYDEGSSKSGCFLVCSDGLYKRMDYPYLETELLNVEGKKLKKTIERLTQHVIQRGETDNISLAIVLCES